MVAKMNVKARKKAREYALQALYGFLLTANPLNEIEQFILLEHAKEKFDKDYFLELLHEVPKHQADLDAEFEPFLDRKITDLDYIEITILRISTYEFKHRFDVPYRVIINEALELAKKFGAVESYKYINGILDKMAPILRLVEVRR